MRHPSMRTPQGVTWTSRPHPEWKPGDKQPNPWNSSKIKTLDPVEIGAAEAYPLVRHLETLPPAQSMRRQACTV